MLPQTSPYTRARSAGVRQASLASTGSEQELLTGRWRIHPTAHDEVKGERTPDQGRIMVKAFVPGGDDLSNSSLGAVVLVAIKSSRAELLTAETRCAKAQARPTRVHPAILAEVDFVPC